MDLYKGITWKGRVPSQSPPQKFQDSLGPKKFHDDLAVTVHDDNHNEEA